jgi:hypothetical protein
VEFEIKTLRTALAVNLDLTDAQTTRLQQLNELDEKRLDAIHQTTMIQQQRSKWHDKTIKHKQFQKGNWALLYDSQIQRISRETTYKMAWTLRSRHCFPQWNSKAPHNR